jgi:asparagine synthase (glutamine-hydrolysing)
MFARTGGRLEDDPRAAAGPAPHVDVSGLARLLTTPVLFGEFAPSSYWRDVDIVWSPPHPRSDDRPFDVVFGDCVARLCGDAEVVAVALSGGVDSLAVLWHV